MNKRFFSPIVILAVGLVWTYGTPKIKYRSTDILSKLNIPIQMQYWRSQDMSGELNLKDERYNFVSKVFARAYQNDLGETLLALVLDAGNFHHPKVCFNSSGFKAKELPDVEFNANGRPFKGHALYTDKGGSGFVIIYWIMIDQKPVNWTEQKIKQLWYSMFNKEKVGLMMRLDIPTRETSIDSAVKLGQDFIRDLSKGIPAEQADYLFGK